MVMVDDTNSINMLFDLYGNIMWRKFIIFRVFAEFL